jgi:hypothetical protein
MANRQQESWGGEVRMPSLLRRLLRRPPPAEDTVEGAHEARKPQPGPSVGENADRAAVGAMSDLYHEGRTERRGKRR